MPDGWHGHIGIAPTRLTIRPMPGECLQSVAVRYANATSVDVPKLLTNGLGLQAHGLASLPFDRDAIRTLAYLASIETSTLLEAAASHEGDDIKVGGVVLPTFLVDVSSRGVAPGILRADGDEPWVRRTWQFECLPCDPDTGEAVRRRCECGIALRWLGCSSIAHCGRCGRDLRDISPYYLPPDIVATTRALADVVEGRPPSIEWMPPTQRWRNFPLPPCCASSP